MDYVQEILEDVLAEDAEISTLMLGVAEEQINRVLVEGRGMAG